MTSFRPSVSLLRRLGDRASDLFDWIDYRPDPDCRWCWAVPVMLGAAFLLSTSIGMFLAFAVALAITIAVLFLGLLGMAAWVVGNAIADVVTDILDAMPKTINPKQTGPWQAEAGRRI